MARPNEPRCIEVRGDAHPREMVAEAARPNRIRLTGVLRSFSLNEHKRNRRGEPRVVANCTY